MIVLEYLAFITDTLNSNHEWLQAQIEMHYLLSLISFSLLTSFILVLPIPASVPLVFSAILFGWNAIWLNYLVLISASMLSYSTARWGTWVFLKHTKRFHSVGYNGAGSISRYSTLPNIILTRIFLPFAIFNYAAGAFKVNQKMFILGTAIGVIPRALTISMIGLGMNELLKAEYPSITTLLSNKYFWGALYLTVVLYVAQAVIAIKRPNRS